jgi:hypothetical protein
VIAAALTLLGGLVSLAFWLIKRRAAKADDPIEQNRKRYEQIDQEIAKPRLHAGHGLSDDLDELERLQRAKKQGDQR